MKVEMTPEQREEQRRSLAYGNTAIDNPLISREAVDRIADALIHEEHANCCPCKFCTIEREQERPTSNGER